MAYEPDRRLRAVNLLDFRRRARGSATWVSAQGPAVPLLAAWLVPFAQDSPGGGQRTNGLAVASLVLGIVGIILCVLFIRGSWRSSLSPLRSSNAT